MEKGTLLVGIIELVVLSLPIGALIWNASALASQVKELKQKQKETTQRVDKLEERNDKAIDEIKASLSALNISFAEIKTALNFISDTIKKEGKN